MCDDMMTNYNGNIVGNNNDIIAAHYNDTMVATYNDSVIANVVILEQFEYIDNVRTWETENKCSQYSCSPGL